MSDHRDALARTIYDRCGFVTDYDDSIGGEGEIACGAPLTVYAERATCARGHQWFACDCGKPSCTGWSVR